MSAHRLNLTKIVLLGAAAAFVITCADAPVSAPSDFNGPLFDYLDGRSGPDSAVRDVFFLPPLMETPDATVLDYGARPSNPYLAPILSLCRLNVGDGPGVPAPGSQALECGEKLGPLPMVYDATGGFYKANLKDLPALGPDYHHRVSILIIVPGEVVNGQQLPPDTIIHAYRDIDPDEGPSVASCTSADQFCRYNVQGAGGLPVKVRIQTGALCFALNPAFDPENSVCAAGTFDLSQGGTLPVLNSDGDAVGVATVDAQSTVDNQATLLIETCTDLRLRPTLTAGRVDLPTFGRCLELDARVVNALTVFGTIELCDAFEAASGSGLNDAQMDRMTVHRFSLDDNFTVALPHGTETECFPEGTGAHVIEFSGFERLVRFALRKWQAIGEGFRTAVGPDPLHACHNGSCAGTDIFRSSYQVAQSAWMEYHGDNPTGDLGIYDLSAGPVTVKGKVKVWDSGEFDDGSDAVPDAVKNVRLTVTAKLGSLSSNTIYTNESGVAEFELAVAPGYDTVVVSGIGVGTGGQVFAPHLDGAEPVQLGVGTLQFTVVGLVPLDFFPPFPELFTMDESGLSARLPGFYVCTVGGEWEGMPFRLVAVNNNGSWVELMYDGLPVPKDQFVDGLATGEGGCFLSDDLLTINKTGAYRLVLNPVFNDRDKVVDGDAFSPKFNVKP